MQSGKFQSHNCLLCSGSCVCCWSLYRPLGRSGKVLVAEQCVTDKPQPWPDRSVVDKRGLAELGPSRIY
ncbi:hypothetical protein OHAE_403 [Ochrobactrum soli]|uniref:Uncharacterized protein n=1 Tax=Ochrobactrum soli TaxID=2448455 RepID=A0A2P9HK99_9HYPH|nr:hypothetical protein OHAE_403 [[Ochrobactrum] soli]